MSEDIAGLTPAGFDDSEGLMTPAEVRAMFGVDAKTVTNWARKGDLVWIRTLGGHRRFSAAQVRELRRSRSGAGDAGG